MVTTRYESKQSRINGARNGRILITVNKWHLNGSERTQTLHRVLGKALLRRWCLTRNLRAVRTQGKWVTCIPMSMLVKGPGQGCVWWLQPEWVGHSEYAGGQWETGSKQHGGRHMGEMTDDLMSHRKQWSFYSECDGIYWWLCKQEWHNPHILVDHLGCFRENRE